MSPTSPSSSSWLRPGRIAAGLLVLLVAFVGLSELAGWPFLAGPMQSALSNSLQRPVRLEASDPGNDGSDAKPLVASASAGSKAGGVKIHLLGGIDIKANRIEIAAPAWSDGKPTLLASNGHLGLRYSDLWRRVAWRAVGDSPDRGRPTADCSGARCKGSCFVAVRQTEGGRQAGLGVAADRSAARALGASRFAGCTAGHAG